MAKKAPWKKVFVYLLPLLKKYKWFIFFGMIALVFIDILQLYIPRLTKHAIDSLSIGSATSSEMARYGLLFILFSIFIGGFRFLWRYLIIGMSRRIERDVRQMFYEHLLSLPIDFFNKNKVGDLMALATNDLEAVRMMIGIGMVASFDAFLWGAAAIACMVYISPIHTLYIALPLPFLTIIFVIGAPYIHKYFGTVQKVFSDLTDKAQETFSGIRVVKSYVQEKYELSNFSKLSKDYVDVNIKLTLIWGMLDPTIGLVIGISVSLIILLVGRDVLIGGLTMGDFVAFNAYLGLAVWPMIAIGWVINLIQRGRASMERLNEILNVQREIGFGSPAEAQERLKGGIEFKHLTFSYPTSKYPALEDISLRVEPGQTIAVVGRTGCGKTSLISLLSRIYSPPEGTLFIDGEDICKIDLERLRKQVGIVPQETFLFSESIMENILFGNVEADKENAIMLAELSKVHDNIIEFPDAYETTVGERGITLSGGQKQRITIARTLLIDPRILILDDSLSSVDIHTEEAILENLRGVRKGRTTIIISHRISAVKDADRIFVLDQGKLVEEGTHEELLELHGIYADIEERQRLEEALY